MYNIAYAINLLQMGRKDRSTRNIETYTEYALWGYRDLKFKILPGVNVTHVMPNSAMLAAMPSDYVYYTKVSIDVCGQSYTLTVNNKIPIPKMVCGVEIADVLCNPSNLLPLSSYEGGLFMYASHYRSGQFVGEYYSLGGGNNSAGYFREDETNRQFVFKGVPRLPITIEYVSDGSKGLDQIIPATAVIPIRNYIDWQLKEYSNGKEKVSDNEKQRAKNIYDESKLVLKNITNTPTIDYYIDVMYAGFQSSLKGVSI